MEAKHKDEIDGIIDFRIQAISPNDPHKYFDFSSSDKTISGAIVLTSTKPSSDLTSLDLRVKVEEKVEWEDLTSSSSSSKIKSKKVHYDTTYTLQKFEGNKLDIGTCIYPFAIPMPEVPDGSFQIISGSHKASVCYKLKAIIKTGTNSVHTRY